MQAKSLIPYFLFTGLLFLLALNYAGDYNNSQEVDLTDYAKSEWVKEWGNWKLDNEVHPRIDKLNTTAIKFYADEDKNREALAELRLFVIKQIPDTTPTTSPDPIIPKPFAPLLTLSISKSEWGLGQTLIFTGSGPAGETAILTVVKSGGCGQNDICSEWQKIDNNGSFRIDFPTKFDDIPGTWKAYVRVGKLQSDTITFEII